MDADDVRRCLVRMAHEVIERNKGARDVVVLGIRRRGVPLARRLAELIGRIDGTKVPAGAVDPRPHRDDVAQRGAPEIPENDVPVDINDKVVVLVDEVLYTGRTVRAAMDALIEFGRPRAVQLAVLVDRGHRELPISPDFVGRNIPTRRTERVTVLLDEIDGTEGVFVEDEAQ